MQLTPHFTLKELTRSSKAAQLGISNTPSPEHLQNLKQLAAMLEEVRALLGAPISISSGYRCPALNKAVGGSATSDHPNGLAADFAAPQFGSVQAVCRAMTLLHKSVLSLSARDNVNYQHEQTTNRQVPHHQLEYV